MSDDDTTVNVRGLEQLIKALKARPPVARVGILGSAGARTSGDKAGGPSNAEIGAAHEFGTSKLPVRSFLRVPISEHLEKKMASSQLFNKEQLDAVIKAGSLLPWVKLVAITAEGIVMDAFATGGFGAWKPSDMRHKKVHMTLVETTQLRESITSEVVEG